MDVANPIAKAASSAISLIAGPLMKKRQIEKMKRAAEEEVPIGDVEEFSRRLTGPQASIISNYVSSLEFEHVAKQKIINQISNSDDYANAQIRNQIQQSIGRSGVFDSWDLTQATDFLEVALGRSCVAAMSSVAHYVDARLAVASAAEVAAAGVKNSEFLERVDNIEAINEFSLLMRKQIGKKYSSVRVANVVRNATAVAYSGLYVTPSFISGDEVFSDTPKRVDTKSIEEILEKNSQIVIVGDPGAGKSTLAAKLVHDIAKNKIRGLQGFTPLLLIVREHTGDIRNSHRMLIDYIEESCRKPHGVDPPNNAVEYLLRTGKAVVVIDGIDELGDSRYRESFRDVIESFRNLYPLARMVVTSRYIGYLEAALDQNQFPPFRILSFSDDQVEAYARKWFSFVGSASGINGEKQKTLLGDFIRESAEGAHDLRSNPLILSLICALYSSSGFIPANKAQIYEKCAEILFETWDRSRGIDNSYRWQSSIRTSVLRLAWRVMNDDEGRQVFPKSEMKEYLGKSVFSERYEFEDDALQAAEEFLQFCAGRAWVLTDMGSDTLEPQYGFVHRTFLEYFAAAQLVKSDPRPEAVWEKIEKRREDSSWQLICQLSVQILDRTYDQGGSKMLSLLMDDFVSSKENSKKQYSLSLATRCLNLISPGYAEIRKVVFESVDQSVGVAAERRTPMGIDLQSGYFTIEEDMPLLDLFECNSTDNKHQIAQYIVRRLEHHVTDSKNRIQAELVIRALDGWHFLEGDVIETIKREVKDAGTVLGGVVGRWSDYPGEVTNFPILARDIRNLYQTLCFGRMVRWSTAHTVASHFLACENFYSGDLKSAFESRLESLYGVLVGGESIGFEEASTFKMILEKSKPSGIYELRDRNLNSFSAKARGSVVLMMLPILRVASLDGHIHSPSFLKLRNNPSSQSAIDIVNNWSLPREAHERVVHWMHYGVLD